MERHHIKAKPQVIRSTSIVGSGVKLDHQEYKINLLTFNLSPVLGCIVFILVLDNEPLAGEVIGLALTPPPELDLQDVGVEYWQMKH